MRKAYQSHIALHPNDKASAHGISRRGFVKGASISALALGLPKIAFAKDSPKPKIAIIGAGLAGLSAAYHLKKAGLYATVYEASNRIGGRVLTAHGALAESLVTELGGELINSDHDDMKALIEEFGLSLFDRSKIKEENVPETNYYFESKAWTEEELVKLLGPICAVIAKDAALIEKDYDKYGPSLDELSVKDYLDKHNDKLTHPVARALLEAGIRVEFGMEPHESSALQLLYNLPVVEDENLDLLSESDEIFAVTGGSDRIIVALKNALPEQIVTGQALVQIRDNESGYALTFSSGKVEQVDYVVMAIPFTAMRHIKNEVKIPANLRSFILEATLGRNEKVIAGFNTRAWRTPQGFSGEVWAGDGFEEAWDSSARQPEIPSGTLTFFLGGETAMSATMHTAEDNAAALVSSLETYLPGIAPAANKRALQTEWIKNPYTNGSYSTFRPGQLTAFGDYFWIDGESEDERQDVRVGNLFFIGEHLSDSSYGFMNGAAETGRLCVASLLRSLSTKKK